MADIQNFRADVPITDPNTGAITPEFLRFLFDKDNNIIEIDDDATAALTAAEAAEATANAAQATANTAQSTADNAQTEVDALETVVAGLEFDDLVDVDMTTTPPTDGQVPAWSAADSLWLPVDQSGGGGGGGGGSLELIEEKIADGSTSTFSFTGIAAGYDHLQMRFEVADGVGTANVIMRVNGDSGANYEWSRVYGGTVLNDDVSTSATSFNQLVVPASVTSKRSTGFIEFTNYDSTDPQKTMRGSFWQANPSGQRFTLLYAGGWNNAAAINRIDVICPANLTSGCSIRLYGVSTGGGGGGGGGGGPVGGRMTWSADQVMGGGAVVKFAPDVTQFDDTSAWDAVNKRVIVPATGVTRAKIEWRVRHTTFSGSDAFNTIVHYNSGGVAKGAYWQGTTSSWGGMGDTSGYVAVDPGDYFECIARWQFNTTVLAADPTYAGPCSFIAWEFYA